MRFLCCLFLIVISGTVVLSQEKPNQESNTDSSKEGDKITFTVPQKAFGMGLVNNNPEVVASTLERAINKDRPVLIRRGLGFYVLVTRKRGGKIDKDSVSKVLLQATAILKEKGYKDSDIENTFEKSIF